MWTYSQKSGEIQHDGREIGTAYSGHGAGLNNPAMEQTPDVGPLPRGGYTIGTAFHHPSKGPVVMHLNPNPGTEEFGRSGFLMHGDNQLVNHSGSEGCIVAARTIRDLVAASPDRQLTVTG
jgi:hypothetical protein